MNLREKHCHCPLCGELERHFFDMDEPPKKHIYCGNCDKFFETKDAVRPSESPRWIPLVKHDEISVVRENNYHGRISHGWFGKDKILVAETASRGFKGRSPCYDQIVRLAEELATELNSKDG